MSHITMLVVKYLDENLFHIFNMYWLLEIKSEQNFRLHTFLILLVLDNDFSQPFMFVYMSVSFLCACSFRLQRYSRPNVQWYRGSRM